MRHHQFSECPRTTPLPAVCSAAILLLLAAAMPPRTYCQNLSVEIEGETKQTGLELRIQAEDIGRWATETTDRLADCELEHFGEFKLYYDYEQTCLTPLTKNRVRCYLHVFAIDPAQASSNGSNRKVWYQKFRMTVSGNFVDQVVAVNSTVRKGEVARHGRMILVAHQNFPSNALQPERRKWLSMDVPTGEPSSHEIKFANRSCCDIEFVKAVPSKGWDKFFASAVLRRGPAPLQAGVKDQFQPWLVLELEPRASTAFWRSLNPYSEESPHTQLSYDVEFRVNGGHEAKLNQSFLVRFRPAFPLVVVSVIAGSLLAAVLSLTLVGWHKGAEPIFGKATTWSARMAAVAKRLFLSPVAAIIVFLLYVLLKGDKDVILFNFPLDPTQCIPAFLIGLIVGSRPIFYYRLVTREQQAHPPHDPPRPGGRGAKMLLLLGFLLLPASALGTDTFRPVSLAYDGKSETVYVLSSPDNHVYGLDAKTGKFRRLAALGYGGVTTDLCLAPWQGKVWVATSGSRALNQQDLWQVTLALTSTSGDRSPARFSSNAFGAFQGIAFDEARRRLLLADPLREGIYAAPLTSTGFGQPVLAFSSPMLKEPAVIAVKGDRAFVASREGGTVFSLELAGEKASLKPILTEVLDPRGLYVTEDGTRLLVADASKPRVLEYNIKLGTRRVLLEEAYLREPHAVVLDSRGHLWVADAWARAVLEIRPGNIKRHKPR